MPKFYRFKLPLLTLFFICTSFYLFAQQSITTLNTPYTEDFDGLVTSGSGDLSGLASGWMVENNNSSTTSIVADNGSTASAGVYSYGTGTNADRALGTLDDASNSYVAGWILENNSGETISTLSISYRGEMWRDKNGAGVQPIAFTYQVASSFSDLNSGTYTAVTDLDYDPAGGGLCFGCSAAANDGNSEFTNVSAILDIPGGLQDGDQICLRWSFPNKNDIANARGVAIDEVEITFLSTEEGVWYVVNGEEDNLRQNDSWTAYSDGSVSAAVPIGDAFGDFEGTNERFIINRSGNFSPGNGNMTLDPSSTIEIEDNLNITLTLGGVDGSAKCNYTIGENVNLTLSLGNSTNLTTGMSFTSVGTGSTVTYEGTFNTHAIIPTTYYNLIIQDDGASGYSYAGDIYIKNDFTYNINSDMVGTINGNLNFIDGGTSELNIPSYSGAGVLQNIVVQSGKTLELGSINANNLVYNGNFINNGTINLTGTQTLTLASGSLTNNATGIVNLASGTSIIGTTSGSINNAGDFNVNSSSNITLATGNFTNSGITDIEENSSLTLTSGDFNNSGDLNIATNAFTTISAGTATNSGTINIADAGSFIQGTGSTLDGTGGTFNITRDKPDGQASGLYNFWSTPVQNTTMGDFNAARQYELNIPGTSSADWSAVADGVTLALGKGYALTGVNSHTFSGVANNGDITYEVQHDGSGNDNFEAMGNPYPSAINAFDFVNDNAEIDGFIRLFNHDDSQEYTVANQQITVAALGNTVATNNTDRNLNLSSMYIASGQGFYVCIPGPTGGDVTFTNSMRGGENDNFKSSSDPKDRVKAKFHLQLIDNDKRYNTLFGIVEGTTSKYDRMWDVRKSNNGSFFIGSVTSNGIEVEIQSIPEVKRTTSIPLTVAVNRTGSFQIHLEASDAMDFGTLIPYIFDAESNHITAILDEDFEFYASEAKSYPNRFHLVFGKTETTTDIARHLVNTVNDDFDVRLENQNLALNFAKPNQVKAITLLDASGKMVATTSTVQAETLMDVKTLQKGVYIVNVLFENGSNAAKKFVY